MMIDNVRRGLVGVAVLLGAAAIALTQTVAGASTPEAPTVQGPVSFGEWSERVWTTAQSGDSVAMEELFAAMRPAGDDPEVIELRGSIDRFLEHETASATRRLARLAEVETELGENLEKDDLPKALVSALELVELTDDRSAVLEDERVKQAVERSDAKFREAESVGSWLEAQDLVYRLNLLYEKDGRYREDLTRLSSRLALLRMYVPEKLHEMRSAQRVRMGEEPLPPYNSLGEKWEDKVAGIDQFMVRRAILKAHAAHVDSAPMAGMLAGGLRSVRALVSTNDLGATFPGLADEKARHDMLDALDLLIGKYDRAVEAEGLDLSRTVTALLESNDKTVRLPQGAVLRAFGDGAMGALDEFSQIYWPDELPQFLRTTQGRFQGVGIQITLDEGLNLKVVTPLEGTPAHRAGIRRGDLIRKVDGDSTLGINVLQAVDRITGPSGSKVTLTIERPGREDWFDVPLVRAEIPIYSVKGWRRNGPKETDWDWFVDPENGIGYVRLTQFSEETVDQFDRAVTDMRARGMRGLVLDLRFNPGGLLSQAVALSNRFIRQGVIVTQHDAGGLQTDSQSARPGQASLRDVPVAVLINEGSASASEIVAGALQDYAKLGEIDAVLVGARSYGKGSVQNVYPLASGTAILKLTERYYHLPDGRLIHRKTGADSWGVEPDVRMAVLPEQLEEAIKLRDDADIARLNADPAAQADEAAAPDPTRLLTEGLDPQLEAALVLLQARTAGRLAPHALLLAPDQRPEPAMQPAGGS